MSTQLPLPDHYAPDQAAQIGYAPDIQALMGVVHDLVDQGNYAASWDASSPGFKRMVTQEEWDRAVHSVREPLGGCLSRTLRSHKLVDSFPGAPRGPFVVLQFQTNFERKQGAVETVTPALGEDHRWRVTSYFIR